MESPWLNTEQAAEYVGFSVKTLHNRRNKGLRPTAHKIGNKLRYHIDELENWIRSNGSTPPKRGRPKKQK